MVDRSVALLGNVGLYYTNYDMLLSVTVAWRIDSIPDVTISGGAHFVRETMTFANQERGDRLMATPPDAPPGGPSPAVA